MSLLYFLLLIFSVFCHVEAQTPSEQDYFPPQAQVGILPSGLTIGAGIMAVIFSLMLFLIAYAKFCYRRGLVHNSQQTTNIFITSDDLQSSGIDKKTIESLPLFRFSALRGSREGLEMECAVCLSKFEDVEVLRLLPGCKHAFHIGCVDEWLQRQASCPLCRHIISADDVAKANDKLFMADIALRRSWSDLSSNGLVFLNSEMLAAVSRNRFLSWDSDTQESLTIQVTEEGGIMKIKEEMEQNHHGLFLSSSGANASNPTRTMNPNDKRSMSEITVHSRFEEFN